VLHDLAGVEIPLTRCEAIEATSMGRRTTAVADAAAYGGRALH
jgi:hypothetical protein